MYSQYIKQYLWWPDIGCLYHRLPSQWRGIITGQESLTQELIKLAIKNGGNENDFCVRVLSQDKTIPLLHEQKKLKQNSQKISIVRQVELQLFKQTVIFARSIIPIEFNQANTMSLKNIGNKPLGHLLFKNGKIRVSQREYSRTDRTPISVYARRTPYDYADKQILVAEFFLPSLLNYL